MGAGCVVARLHRVGAELRSIKRVETAGGSGVTLAETGASAEVSPDGAFIAFGASEQPGCRTA